MKSFARRRVPVVVGGSAVEAGGEVLEGVLVEGVAEEEEEEVVEVSRKLSVEYDLLPSLNKLLSLY